jgi:23S rRNA (uracil1939-C5)-methyltransferase
MIKRNDVLEIKIDNLTMQGYGVGRYNEKVIFVKNALPGEIVKAKVTAVKKNHMTGIIEEIIQTSDIRKIADCKLFGECGGCALQNIHYKSQLKYKEQTVYENLKRIGGIENPGIEKIIGMDTPWKYRNKAQYPIQLIDKEVYIGFYKEKSHAVIDIEDCPIQKDITNRVRRIVKDFIINNNISIHNEKAHKGIVRNVLIRVSSKTGKIMVCIVINSANLPLQDMLVFNLKTTIPEISSVYLNINKKRTKSNLGDKFKLIFGDKKLLDSIGDKDYLLSPGAFFQVNSTQTGILYDKIVEFADFKGNETVFDMYSGTGSIGIYIADRVKKVYCIESYEKAVEDAIENAKLNKTENIEFIHGKSENIIDEMLNEGIKPDIIILDPPRKGCDKSLIESITKINPEKIIYISCDPATLSRDIKQLVDNNKYILNKVQPIDMFPQTGHVECVVRIQSRKCL